MWGYLIVVLCGSYLLGCLHGARIAQLISGVNLKQEGVKNYGASNATIVLGKKFGALVAAIDIGKGVLAVFLARIIAEQVGFSAENYALILFVAGAAVVIGHTFPIHMKFNGGKGTATLIGILLGIDWFFGLIAFIIFLVTALATDFLVFGVLMLYLSLLSFSIWLTPGIWPPLITTGIFFIAIYKHIENIQRLKKGEEKRITTIFGKKKKF